MEQWTYNRTYSGVPQGSGVSPVLANVYLHELDKFMEEYAQKYNRGKKKQMNSDYNKVVKKHPITDVWAKEVGGFISRRTLGTQ